MSNDSVPSGHDRSATLDGIPRIRRFRGATFLLLLSLLGIAISLYLEYQHTGTVNQFEVSSALCSVNETFDCHAVAASSYSQIFGMSIASLGALFYFVLLGLSVFPTPSERLPEGRYWNVVLLLTVVALIPSAYLLVVSAVVLKKFCLLCLSLDVLNVVLVLLAGTRSRSEARAIGQGTGGALLEGLTTIGRFVSAPSRADEPQRVVALLSASALIFLFFALQLLPSFLVEQVFRVQEAEQTEAMMVERSVADWRAARERPLAVDRGTDPRNMDFARGPADAALEIVAYSDFECPFCRKFATSIEEILKRHPVRFVFKNFPLDQACNPLIDRKFHEYSCAAAKSARCAGQQSPELFWKAHDAIFSEEHLGEDALRALPATIGADQAAFDRCMGEEGVTEKISSDIAEGERLRLEGTPAVFIAGKQIKYPTAEVLNAILAAASERSAE